MGKLVVIEGFNCVGKSIICDSIHSNFNFNKSKSIPHFFQPIVKIVKNKKSHMELFIYLIAHLLVSIKIKLSKNDYIVDRWLSTTLIRFTYGGNKIPIIINKIIKLLYIKPALVIIIYSEYNIIRERCSNRYIHENDIHKYSYDFLFNFYSSSITIVNNGSKEELISSVHKIIKNIY